MPKVALSIKNSLRNILIDRANILCLYTVRNLPCVLVINYFNEEAKSEKLGSIHLYIRSDQTDLNVSFFNMLKKLLNKLMNLIQMFCVKFFSKFYFKEKRCIWGSLVNFSIKMNFID